MEDNIEEKKVENKSMELKVPVNVVYAFFAFISVALLVLTKILMNCGVAIWGTAFYGVWTIIIFAFPCVGAILSILNSKKPNFEFYANIFAISISLLCL